MKYKVKEIVGTSEYEMKNAPKQYKEIKKKHPECVILFRVGDFYESYCEDARTCCNVLGLTLLTHIGENNSCDLVRFRHYNLDLFLPKLIRAGKRIAICEKENE